MKHLMNKIIQGDCLEKLKELDNNSIDTIITDPPYGLSFMGKKWDYDVPQEEVWRECLRVLKPGGTALIFAGSRTYHRMAVRVEDAGFILKDCIMWLYGSGFPKATDISKQLDKGVERKVLSENYRGKNAGKKSGIMGETVERIDKVTEPATEEAKLWNGWKSHGLKPAYEPILVAMKPNDGTYANNALKHGVSGLNIDGGRIGTEIIPAQKRGKAVSTDYGDRSKNNGITPEHTGRFPANVILDEEAGKMLDEQSGVLKTNAGTFRRKLGEAVKDDGLIYGKREALKEGTITSLGDKGGASRFFYCAKASKSERNEGCEELEEKQTGSFDGNADVNNTNRKIGADPSKQNQTRTNHHPTVKPLKLMEYLCTLTKTPTGGIVLDPYGGSGTTMKACQKTDRDCITIEREGEYIKIIEARTGVKAENYVERLSKVSEIPEVKEKIEGKLYEINMCNECGGTIKKIDGGRMCQDCMKEF